jgi:hypothetical protein
MRSEALPKRRIPTREPALREGSPLLAASNAATSLNDSGFQDCDALATGGRQPVGRVVGVASSGHGFADARGARRQGDNAYIRKWPFGAVGYAPHHSAAARERGGIKRGDSGDSGDTLGLSVLRCAGDRWRQLLGRAVGVASRRHGFASARGAQRLAGRRCRRCRQG